MDCKVLVVDDSIILRKAIRKGVVHAGISDESIREAANGKLALDQVNEDRPDLVLLDINMPVMDGEQFLEALSKRDDYAKMTVIVVSTEVNIKRLARLAKLGAKGRLHKPFEPEKLIEMISKHMNKDAA